MQELIKQLFGIVRGMWRYRWPGVFLAWLVAIVGVVMVFRIPDQYEASARIHVDTQSILKPLMAGLTVQPNVAQQVNMLSRTLLSRPNMERLVRMADLDLGAKTPEAQEALITGLAKKIEIRGSGRDNLYTLAIKDGDQDKARRIIQSLTSIFVESSLGASRKDTDSAKNFLDEQIRRYEAKLEETEARLKDFRLRNLEIRATDGGADVASQVHQATGQLQTARLELREAENARDSVKQQLEEARGQPAGGVLPSQLSDAAAGIATPELDARIEGLKRNLDGLQQRYTDQHPDVVIIRRQVRELEDQKAQEIAELRKAAGAAGPAAASGNPAVQALSQMLAATEVQVATLRTRVGEFEARLARARESLKTAPALEAEAAQLNRDHAINKRTYDDFVARRQKAMMSGELEGAAGVAEFRLIDPPRVSPRPVSPNRVAMLPLALLAGIAAGLGLTFLISQLRPAFYDPDELRTKTGVPLLGVVSMRIDDATKRRERGSLLRFAGATGGLVAAFGVGLALLAALG